MKIRTPFQFQFPIILCVILGLLVLSGTMAPAADYDIVINKGRVMDPETMYDSVANVGIKDGQIAVITKNKIKGKDTIDAKGLVVAPGFIADTSIVLNPTPIA